MDFTPNAIADAIAGVTDMLGLSPMPELQREYQDEKHPTLLSYEKVEESPIALPVIQKYCIGAQTYLDQPTQYYDIFRSCRHVMFLARLHTALETVTRSVRNFESRLEQLRAETLYDRFESVLYEILVAASYAEHSAISNVEFLSSTDSLTPDLQYASNRGRGYVECKKLDRSKDIAIRMRDTVRDKTTHAMNTLRQLDISALIEVSFHCDPLSVEGTLITDLCLLSLKSGIAVLDRQLTVYATPLPYRELPAYTLFPSPQYFFERYQYVPGGPWFGIVNQMEARSCGCGDVVDLAHRSASTWLDEVRYESAVKWRITDDQILWKYKKLGYRLLFKGLEQVQAKGTNGILHVWLERDKFLGHRQGELLEFFERLRSAQKDMFSWIVFNETILDVSVEGRFDLIEHAHPIAGPTAALAGQLVPRVFTHHDELCAEDGEFGKGTDLPNIDEVARSRRNGM